MVSLERGGFMTRKKGRGICEMKRICGGRRRDTCTFVPNPPPCLRSTLHVQGRALGVAHGILCRLSSHKSCCGHIPVALMVRTLLSKGKCIFLPVPEDPGGEQPCQVTSKASKSRMLHLVLGEESKGRLVYIE